MVTKEIANLIRSNQQTVVEAIKAMDDGAAGVAVGTGQVNQSGEALAKILEAAQAVQEQVEGIAAAAQEVMASAEEVVDSMDSISAVVEENSAATEEMSAQVEEVTASAQSLQVLAQSLQGVVGQFKLETVETASSESVDWAAVVGKTEDQANPISDQPGCMPEKIGRNGYH